VDRRGACAACRQAEESVPARASRHYGDGGYASHVLVPHPRYLLDYGRSRRRSPAC